MPNIAAAGGGAAGAVGALFGGFAAEKKADMFRIEAQMDLLKGEGARLEGEGYGLARDLALVNKAFTAESTAIQLAQAERKQFMSFGATRAAAGASGLAASGSVIDVLEASEQQAALERQVLVKQGLITEEGYQEQADVYGKMVEATGVAVEAAKMAHKMHLKAADAEDEAATGHYIGAGIKGVFAVANLFI